MIGISSGDYEFSAINLLPSQHSNWDIHISSGNCLIDLKQSIIPLTKKIASFEIDTSSGYIDLLLDISSTIGLLVEGSVSSGNIDIRGTSDSYISPNYYSALFQLDFVCHVSSGNIIAIIED